MGGGVVMIASYKFHFIREHDNLNMNINPPDIQRKHMDGIYSQGSGQRINMIQ